jgi:hypothetical protein
MTTIEVEAIFGESTEFIPWPPQTDFGRGELEFLWSGNDGQAVIEFKDMRVRDKQWHNASTTSDLLTQPIKACICWGFSEKPRHNE